MYSAWLFLLTYLLHITYNVLHTNMEIIIIFFVIYRGAQLSFWVFLLDKKANFSRIANTCLSLLTKNTSFQSMTKIADEIIISYSYHIKTLFEFTKYF